MQTPPPRTHAWPVGQLTHGYAGCDPIGCSRSFSLTRAVTRVRHGLHHQFIHVAPAPVLARLEAADDRMLGGVEVLRGMPPRRIVAAADMSAGHAKPEVNPVSARREAFFAAGRGASGHAVNLIEMRSRCRHQLSSGGLPLGGAKRNRSSVRRTQGNTAR